MQTLRVEFFVIYDMGNMIEPCYVTIKVLTRPDLLTRSTLAKTCPQENDRNLEADALCYHL